MTDAYPYLLRTPPSAKVEFEPHTEAGKACRQMMDPCYPLDTPEIRLGNDCNRANLALRVRRRGGLGKGFRDAAAS
jgi:hypothetical protein